MAAEKLVKDIGDVYNKLFDHHGPISREVNFYVHEFESKRKEREISRLNQASVNCSHIEMLFPHVESLAVDNLSVMSEKLDKAVEKSNKITDDKLPEENTARVEERRHKMHEEWDEFEIKTNKTREEIEQCHVERMEKLNEDIERYTDEIIQ